MNPSQVQGLIGLRCQNTQLIRVYGGHLSKWVFDGDKAVACIPLPYIHFDNPLLAFDDGLLLTWQKNKLYWFHTDEEELKTQCVNLYRNALGLLHLSETPLAVTKTIQEFCIRCVVCPPSGDDIFIEGEDLSIWRLVYYSYYSAVNQVFRARLVVPPWLAPCTMQCVLSDHQRGSHWLWRYVDTDHEQCLWDIDHLKYKDAELLRMAPDRLILGAPLTLLGATVILCLRDRKLQLLIGGSNFSLQYTLARSRPCNYEMHHLDDQRFVLVDDCGMTLYVCGLVHATELERTVTHRGALIASLVDAVGDAEVKRLSVQDSWKIHVRMEDFFFGKNQCLYFTTEDTQRPMCIVCPALAPEWHKHVKWAFLVAPSVLCDLICQYAECQTLQAT
jgi:hypothetical protein